jgi:hypothetical protein
MSSAAGGIRRGFIEHRLQFGFGEKPAAEDDGRNLSRVRDVATRIGVEQNEVRDPARLNRTYVNASGRSLPCAPAEGLRARTSATAVKARARTDRFSIIAFASNFARCLSGSATASASLW